METVTLIYDQKTGARIGLRRNSDGAEEILDASTSISDLEAQIVDEAKATKVIQDQIDVLEATKRDAKKGAKKVIVLPAPGGKK